MILVDVLTGRYLVTVSYSSTAIWALTKPWMIGNSCFLGQKKDRLSAVFFALLGHLLVGEGLPGLLRGVLGMIELVSSRFCQRA